jgi:hypothetical protein
VRVKRVSEESRVLSLFMRAEFFRFVNLLVGGRKVCRSTHIVGLIDGVGMFVGAALGRW